MLYVRNMLSQAGSGLRSHKLAELFYMYVSKLYYEAALSRHFLLRAADSGKHLAGFERSSLGHQLMILL